MCLLASDHPQKYFLHQNINFASNHIFWVEMGWGVGHLAQRGPKAKFLMKGPFKGKIISGKPRGSRYKYKVGAREGRVKSRVCKSGRANHSRMGEGKRGNRGEGEGAVHSSKFGSYLVL